MALIEEVTAVTYTRTYALTLKMMTAVTTLVIVVMAGLYSILGFPPGFDTYYEVLYFHSIAIGLAALATFLILAIFKLQRYEPPIDFPIAYRAFAAVLFAAAGGILYLSPVLDATFPDIPLGLFVVAFIIIGDVAGALFVQLLILPRKIAGVYDPKLKGLPPRMWPQYVLRMVPSRKEWSIYSQAGAAYWLALASVGSAFVAGMIGFVRLWVAIFGPGIFSVFVPMFGDVPTFLGALVGSHSHEMGIAIMAGVVALAAQQFKVLDFKGVGRRVASLGLYVAAVGIVAISIVLIAEAAIAFAPPTLFASGPGGVNGMAGDDTVMSIVGVGAMIALIPLALAKLDRRQSWKDSVRLALLGSWIMAVINSIGEGFFVEFHEDLFGSTMAANHDIFANVNPMFGIFTLTAIALVLLAVDYYAAGGMLRRFTGWVAGIGIILAGFGSSLWAFIDPSFGGIPYWIYIAGVWVLGASAVMGASLVYTASVRKITRKEM